MTTMGVFSWIGLAAAIAVGILTAVVSSRALRPLAGNSSPAIGIFVGSLTAIGLSNHGGIMSALLIPYEALGLALAVMFLLGPFLRDKKNEYTKPDLPIPDHNPEDQSDDPWAQEIRRGGKKADQFKVRRRKR